MMRLANGNTFIHSISTVKHWVIVKFYYVYGHCQKGNCQKESKEVTKLPSSATPTFDVHASMFQFLQKTN